MRAPRVYCSGEASRRLGGEKKVTGWMVEGEATTLVVEKEIADLVMKKQATSLLVEIEATGLVVEKKVTDLMVKKQATSLVVKIEIPAAGGVEMVTIPASRVDSAVAIPDLDSICQLAPSYPI